MKSIMMAALLLTTPLALSASASTDQALTSAATSIEATGSTTSGSDWVVTQADHVSGVSNALQITNPAKISYDSLMDDTTEMKELKRKGIKKDSARGQVLVSAAKDRVRRAAKAVMTDKGHCSVWKTIKHKKKQAVTDLTEIVRKKLNA